MLIFDQNGYYVSGQWYNFFLFLGVEFAETRKTAQNKQDTS